MARNFSEKKRGSNKRKQKAVYLVISEGMNKTETLYLSNFQDQERDFYIRFIKAGSNTDAESLYKTLKMKWNELGLSEKDGDKGLIVLDIDNDEKKAQKVSQLIGDNPIPAIRFIISNPTFEVWFLLHFKYTTKFYQDGNVVIGDLKKYIPYYSKNVDVYQPLGQKTDDAVKNAAKLAEHFAEEKWPSTSCNPRTDVGELVELIRG